MKKRGQVSVEYILIVAIAMMIILPGIFLFRNYIFESNDQILESRLTEISLSLLGKARKMYYYGPPSKSTLQPDMPPQVDNFYIQRFGDEYFLIFVILTNNGRQNVEFSSEVPIVVGEKDIVCDIPCEGTCECFTARHYSEGLKNLQVEASDDCPASPFCVIITEISPDLPE
ncbi:MAG: hypothetical protein ABIJ34_00990 [archaeon]